MLERWGFQFNLSVFWVPWCCLLAIALSATPNTALAEDLARAQAAYNEGFDLYQKGKYRKALRYFDQALKMAPTTKRHARFRSFLQFLSGMSQYRLRRWQLARRNLDAYLKTGQGRKEHRQQATLALRKSKQRLRQLAALRRARLRKRAWPQARPPVRRPVITQTRPPRTIVPKKEVIPVRHRPTPLRTTSPTISLPTPSVPRAGGRSQQPRTRGGTRSALVTTPSSPTNQQSVPPVSSYVLSGVGGAVLVAGGVLLGAALATQSPAIELKQQHAATANPDSFARDVTDPLASARTMAYIAYPMLGAGVALAGTGLILFFAARQPAPTSPPDATKPPTQLFLHRLFP